MMRSLRSSRFRLAVGTALFLLVSACPLGENGGQGTRDSNSTPETGSGPEVELPDEQGTELQCTPYQGSQAEPIVLNTTTSSDAAPFFIFPYRHTEDPFNLDYVKELYDEILPILDKLDATVAADLGLVWTIQFQGADVNALVDAGTTYASTLQKLSAAYDAGRVRFGYHGQHEPTYNNRSLNAITAASTWDDVVQSVGTFIACKKTMDGECAADHGGGIEAVLEHLGEVDLVSGIAVPQGSNQFESMGASYAIAQLLPERQLGLGFSDHAPGGESDAANVAQLAQILTPSGDTTGTMFWMDNTLRLNDTNALEMDKGGMSPQTKPVEFVSQFESLDHERRHVFLLHMGTKYIYAKTGNSPTQLGYARYLTGEDPKLRSDEINPLTTRKQYYDYTKANLTYLSQQMHQRPGSRFVSGDDIMNLVAPDEYWAVTPAELYALARWLLQEWDSANKMPPPFASDGAEFYSLRDALVLLSQAAAADNPDTLTLTTAYGPLAAVNAVTQGCLMFAELQNVSSAVSSDSSSILPSSYDTSLGVLNGSQVLYALASWYAASYEGDTATGVEIPLAAPAPATFDLISGLGSLHAADTSWSLKPARIRF